MTFQKTLILIVSLLCLKYFNSLIVHLEYRFDFLAMTHSAVRDLALPTSPAFSCATAFCDLVTPAFFQFLACIQFLQATEAWDMPF